jgi:hypothetical protein
MEKRYWNCVVVKGIQEKFRSNLWRWTILGVLNNKIPFSMHTALEYVVASADNLALLARTPYKLNGGEK